MHNLHTKETMPPLGGVSSEKSQTTAPPEGGVFLRLRPDLAHALEAINKYPGALEAAAGAKQTLDRLSAETWYKRMVELYVRDKGKCDPMIRIALGKLMTLWEAVHYPSDLEKLIHSASQSLLSQMLSKAPDGGYIIGHNKYWVETRAQYPTRAYLWFDTANSQQVVFNESQLVLETGYRAASIKEHIMFVEDLMLEFDDPNIPT